MVNVKFITTGANSAFGGFSTGDSLRCGEEMAKHLVDFGVAVYAEARAPVAVVVVAAEVPIKRKAK